MVEVIKYGQKRRILCQTCGALLEFEKDNVKTDTFRTKGGDPMIKQMDEMVSGLAVARRRTRRIMRYWGRTMMMVIVAFTMPIWAIPYLLWRRRHG